MGKDDAAALTAYVPVMVPPELAGEVLRRVADHVDASGAFGVRDWGDATTKDKTRFFSEASELSFRVADLLARNSLPMRTKEVADQLGVTTNDVAGAVGPLNKRAKKHGWVSPVRTISHFNAGKGTFRGLVLHDELKNCVLSRFDETEDERS